MIELIRQKLKVLYQLLFDMDNTQTEKSKKLYEETLKYLGTDASPRDLAADEYGCVESVTTICHPLFPDVPIFTGTWTFWNFLKSNVNFVEVKSPLAGDIIVNPTNGRHIGHTGIFLSSTDIASNDSKTGKFLKNYTLTSWRTKFYNKLPEYIFRRIR